MSEAVPATMEYRGRKTRRADGHARRQAILEAALRIIVRDGLRAVRHRAVAQEAQVPLAATTYYFRDLNELISDAFTLFAERTLAGARTLEKDTFAALDSSKSALSTPQGREKLAHSLTDFVMHFLRSQVADRDGRQVEQAFRQEALRNDKLASDVQVPDRAHLNTLERFFQALGSTDAVADAHLVLGAMAHWEFHLLLNGDSAENWQLAERSMRRQLNSLLKS